MKIKNPIIIIGAPRSGTTLLFSIFSSHPELWSLYSESESIFKQSFHPAQLRWERGNELSAEDASPAICQAIQTAFYDRVLNYQIVFPNSYTRIYTYPLRERVLRVLFRYLIAPILKPESVRIVEKTPKNCLRVPFLNAVFQDSFFIFLTRDPRANISSLMEGWRTPDRFLTYEVPGGVQLEGYEGSTWNFLLPPKWETYARGKRLEEVCAFQYRTANQHALESLSEVPRERQMMIRYEDLVESPRDIVRRICQRTHLSYTGGLSRMAEDMPPVNITEQPDREKWKKNETEVVSVLYMVRELAQVMGYSV